MSNETRNSKQFRDLKRTAEEIKRLERRERLQREGRPRSVRRKENRETQLPDNRTCPSCGEVYLNSRQWVVRSAEIVPQAVCLKCHRLTGKE